MTMMMAMPLIEISMLMGAKHPQLTKFHSP